MQFGICLEEALCDCLVCRLCRKSLQTWLLLEGDLTLAKALDLARSLQGAPQSMQILKGTTELALGLMEHKKARVPFDMYRHPMGLKVMRVFLGP